METQLPPDFSAFLSGLSETGAEFLLVGGYAVGFHGYVRVTGDIDLWVRQTRSNAERVVAAIRAFGFDLPEVAADRFLQDKFIARMGHPPNRIEVMASIDGVDFASCWERRLIADFDGLPVPVIGLADLRRNKRASGRPKDLLDLVELPHAPK